MKACYIHSAVSISAQKSFEVKSLDLVELSGEKAEAIAPNFKDYIAPMALRRMATGVKMGVTAASRALQNAGIQRPDAILTGTGMGCIEDTEKFLNSIIAHDEEFLTPTSFIQSTHNTVGAQIALGLQCKGYNNTYVHGALSFESALLDGLLTIRQGEANSILVGGIDELGTEFVDYVRMMEDQNENGIQVPMGEGASFFVLSPEKKINGIELLDIKTFSKLSQNSLKDALSNFLVKNKIHAESVDIVLLGTNGDGFDTFYTEVSQALPSHTKVLSYKQFSGEFYTASAFGLFLGCEILSSQQIPKAFLKNKESNESLKTILLYNQFKGRDHSFILLRTC